MRLLQSLSETHIGRALIAYFFDLPRWTLANLIFAASLIPAHLALGSEMPLWALATLPTALVIAGMINMAAAQTVDDAPRWSSITLYPATYIVAFVVWLIAVALLTPMLLFDLPLALIFAVGIVLLSLLLIGVFALFVPSLLKARSGVIVHNALVLALPSPMVGLGIIALAVVGGWAMWVSKGALVVVVPALWVLITSFSIDERIAAVRSMQSI